MRLSPAREPGPLTANIQSAHRGRRNIFEVGDDLPSHEAAAEAVTLAQPRTVTSQRLAWLWAQVFPATPQRVEHLGNLVLGGR